MLALGRYEAGVHACGFHTSLTHDKRNRFTFEDDTCPVCAGIAQYTRLQLDGDEAARDEVKAQMRLPRDAKLPPLTPDPADGRSTYTRLLPESAAPTQKRGVRGHQA